MRQGCSKFRLAAGVVGVLLGVLAGESRGLAQSTLDVAPKSAPVPSGTAPSPVSRFALQWAAPPGCSDSAQVLARVTQLIGGAIDAQLAEPLDVVAMVRPTSEATHATLELTDLRGLHRRELSAANCTEMAEAVSLVLALAINPALAQQHLGGGPGAVGVPSNGNASADGSADPSAAAPPTAPPQILVEPLPNYGLGRRTAMVDAPSCPAAPKCEQRAATEGSRVRVGTSVEARFGLLPDMALGYGAVLAYELKPLSFSLTASYLQKTADIAGAVAQAVSFDTVLITPKVCWFVANSALTVGPCVAMPVGATSAKAHGIERSRRERHFRELTEFGLEARLLHRDAAFVTLAAELAIPWERTSYQIEGVQVFRLSALGARLGLQTGLVF